MDVSRYPRFERGPAGQRPARYEARRHWMRPETRVGYDYAHAIVDDHSRLAFVELHDDSKAATVTAFVERALAFFAAHGIRAQRLMTDNAFSYVRNHSLRDRLESRGIRHLTTRAYRRRLGLSDELADESLREKARRRLEKVLDGDDEAAALRAAQSLYSYRAAQPPADHDRREGEGGVYLASGRKVVSLAGILELCLDDATGFFDDARMQGVVLRAAERVRELQAARVRVEAMPEDTPSP